MTLEKQFGCNIFVHVLPYLFQLKKKGGGGGGGRRRRKGSVRTKKLWYKSSGSQPKSPDEIKRREVSWTLTKRLAQKRSIAGRWCWARERELDFFCFSCSPTAELHTSSLWLFCIAVETAIAWFSGCCAMPDGHCLNILLFWRQSMAAFAFQVGARFEVTFFCPPFPTCPHRPSRLHGH